MATQVSPGVVINEVDRSDSLTQVALTQGGIAGPFVWGPIEQVVTVSSETSLAAQFGKPTSETATTFFTAANFLSYANTLRVVRAANTAARNATWSGGGLLIKNRDKYEVGGWVSNGVVAAKYAGQLGNSLRVELCANASAFKQNSTNITEYNSNVAITINSAGTTVRTSAVLNTFSVGDIIVASGQKRRVLAINANAQILTINTAFTTNLTSATAFSREWRYSQYFTGAPTTTNYASARGGSLDELHIIVVDEDGDITGTPGTVVERYEGLSKGADARADDGATLYYKDVLNSKSAWVWWTDHPAAGTNWGNTVVNTTFVAPKELIAASLSGGVAGETNADYQTAYDKLTDASVDVSFILGGAANSALASYIISNVVEPRKYTMGFFSPEYDDVVNNVGNEVNDVVAFRESLPSSSYAVLDSGWKYQYDKYNQVYRWIPLNGDIAGCAARTDTVAESWFSPAGFTRGQIKIGNSIKLAWNPNQSQRDDLYPKGINPVVAFPGEGTVLFGDKTLQAKPSAFDRINVRRLFIVLEKTIERSAKYQLFEQNDEFTRNSFINLVEPFLRSVKGRRGISDFYVVCDSTNNPQDAVDRNEFRADIYIKPIRSINFIQLNFVAVRSDVSFSEVITNLG